jgi:hypothetical protein
VTEEKEEKEPTISVRLSIHTSDREVFRIDLGDRTEAQIAEINEACTRGLNNQVLVHDWIITDTKNKTHHFNVGHIVCIVVEES